MRTKFRKEDRDLILFDCFCRFFCRCEFRPTQNYVSMDHEMQEIDRPDARLPRGRLGAMQCKRLERIFGS